MLGSHIGQLSMHLEIRLIQHTLDILGEDHELVVDLDLELVDLVILSEETQGTKHLGERLWILELRRAGESSAICRSGV